MSIETPLKIEPPVKTMLIFFDQTDRWKDVPLAEAIVRVLAEHGVSGATVMSGVMGYGVHRRIHRKGLFGISDDKPNMLVIIENEQKLRAVLPVVRPMIAEGVVVLLDAELII